LQILKGEVAHSPKKPAVIEGRARAKFDFTAQTNLELPLKKGEIVVLTRRIDHNWWEGRNGNKTGIFPDSYVTVLQEPSQNKPGKIIIPIPDTTVPILTAKTKTMANDNDK
jgi:sorbin and SH3 domain containing protein 1